MATTIFFNGRTISRPGSYSEVDPSGLEQVGLGASGIVACLGTAEGGIPVSAIESIEDLIRITRPEDVRSTFKSGDLREAGGILFEPSADGEIQAGAQEVVFMKVNPATQSQATFSNSQGDAVNADSVDYGAFTEQINVTIQDGTTKGKLLTIIFEDVTESVDDLGGDTFFTLDYVNGSSGWGAMDAQVVAGGDIVCNGSRSLLGKDSDVLTPLAAPGAIEVLSAAGGDVGQTVKVYGLDGSGNPIVETLTLNGTTPVAGTLTFAAGDVLGAKVIGITVGAVDVRPSGGGATILQIGAGSNGVTGMSLGIAMFVSGTPVSVTPGAASTDDLILEGTNAAGATILEKLTFSGTGTETTTNNFTSITGIISGDLAVATTFTYDAEAAKGQAAIQNTLQKMDDFFNARNVSGAAGFVWVTETTQTSLNPSNLDVMPAAVSILNSGGVDFYADLYSMIAWINQNSVLITAEAATGASGGFPDNTPTPVFLSGGTEGTPAFSDWQDALDLLKGVRINTITAITGDPAVHAAVEAHCAYMGGIGRSERDAVLGALNAALTDVPTKAEYKQQAVDLNSRHTRLVGQAMERFNSSGEREEFLPPFTACVGAGMQAGSPVGTSLTFKYGNVLGFRQHSSWNPVEDAEELIQAGLFFLENVDGVGRRWVRNVTTFLQSDNIAFTEASVNEAVNFATFNFRTNMEFAVGRQGFSGTVNAAKGVAITTLGLQVDANVLTQWRSLDIVLVVDVLEVSVEIAPVIPINFVKSVIHLVTVQQQAA